MSKSSELDKLAKAYIVDRIDATGYDVPKLETDAERIQFLYDTFMREYGWEVRRIGTVKALAEYLKGLPSCCTIAFYHSDILALAREWGSLLPDATERQEQAILDNWWNFAANKTAQLFRKYVGEF